MNSMVKRKCTYKGEIYSVKFNGEVYRHAKDKNKPRKYDNEWTFGLKNKATGYMMIGSHRIHIIVATAFYGEKDSKTFVVDHCDMNRENNCVSNLQWLTKLESALFNEVSLKSIIYRYKSIINFMKAPNKPINENKSNNPFWLQEVSSEDAKEACKKLLDYVNLPEESFRKYRLLKVLSNDIYYYKLFRDITPAKSPSTAVQVDWHTPTDFPLCPTHTNYDNPIEQYYKQLAINKIITQNQYACHYIKEFVQLADNKLIIRSYTKDNVKEHSIITISFMNNVFEHFGRYFFSESGAQKQFTIMQGLQWEGEDSIDDFC